MFLEVGTDASAHFQNDPDLDFLISRVQNIISNLFICKSLTFHKCDSVAFQAIWTLLNGAKTNMPMVCPLSSARLRHGRAEGPPGKGGYWTLSGDTKRCGQYRSPRTNQGVSVLTLFSKEAQKTTGSFDWRSKIFWLPTNHGKNIPCIIARISMVVALSDLQ